MPNHDLDELLTSTCTRRRLTERRVAGQTAYTHQDLPGITCGIRPLTAAEREKGYGVVPEATTVATLHPEADVRSPDAVAETWDVVMVTAGPYTGAVFRVGFVHERVLVACRKAEVVRLEQLPPSTEL